MIHGNDLIAVLTVFCIGIFSCHFERTLNGFGAAVGEKYFFQSAGFFYLLCRFCHRNRIVEIGNMGQFIDLVFQRLGIFLIVISQRLNRDTCCKVQILFSIYIIKMYTLSTIQYDLIPVIGMKNGLFCFFNIWITHDRIFPPYLPK